MSLSRAENTEIRRKFLCISVFSARAKKRIAVCVHYCEVACISDSMKKFQLTGTIKQTTRKQPKQTLRNHSLYRACRRAIFVAHKFVSSKKIAHQSIFSAKVGLTRPLTFSAGPN